MSVKIPAVAVRDVSKSFFPAPGWLRVLVRSPITEEIPALKSVSLDVAPGEICAVVGPNGAGKTTLFRILVGLTTPTSGEAHVLGRHVVTESLAVRRQIGWMPTSDKTLFERHTAAENLRFAGRLYGMAGQKLETAVQDTLEIVGLDRHADNAVLSLSAGMRARLQLGRALLHSPRLLILDEPTASVDPVASYELINLIIDIVRENGVAAIVSSHRLDEIETLHSHVVLLHQGRVMFDGDLDDLRAKIDRPHFELRTPTALQAEEIVRTLSRGSNADRRFTSHGDTVRVVLGHQERIGDVMAAIGDPLSEVVSIREVEIPLREILAEVYGLKAGGQA